MSGPAASTRPARAMVLAAGFGTRMGALTRDRPKPLLQVAGRALIDQALDLVVGAGADTAIVNLHYRGPQIRQHLAARAAPRVVFSDEQPVILDTGGIVFDGTASEVLENEELRSEYLAI